MYTFDSRIRYSETDETGCLTLDAIINYLQDCTNFESEDLGVGIEYLSKNKIMWMLSSWQIVIKSYPSFAEKVTIGTQSYGYDKIIGYRNFLITGEDGKTIVIANSNWVLMDMEKGTPRIITPEIGDVYGKYEPLEMDYAPRKIKMPDNGKECEEFIVKEYHLDTNHHVNNGQYIRMAMFALGINNKVKELRVEYKKQALLGDKIIPVVYKDNNNAYVSLNNEKGKVYALVKFIF